MDRKANEHIRHNQRSWKLHGCRRKPRHTIFATRNSITGIRWLDLPDLWRWALCFRDSSWTPKCPGYDVEIICIALLENQFRICLLATGRLRSFRTQLTWSAKDTIVAIRQNTYQAIWYSPLRYFFNAVNVPNQIRYAGKTFATTPDQYFYTLSLTLWSASSTISPDLELNAKGFRKQLRSTSTSKEPGA